MDGITDMDTGSNSTLHYEPNIDAIQELKVLTSNYQAEFGRNSGGTITVVTKSGTQQFHGTAAWNHRHEGLERQQLDQQPQRPERANGQEVSPRSKYRFNVETYSIGGPVFIPKVFNTEKKKLFFFWSQEYTGQFVPGGAQNKYTPTRAGARRRLLAKPAEQRHAARRSSIPAPARRSPATSSRQSASTRPASPC